jgi:hypothetical protein
VRRFLPKHEVHTIVDMQWPDQLENGELLKVAEESGFDVLVTADQNIRYQQNLMERKLSLVVLGSNIWPIVLEHYQTIASKVAAATHGSYDFIQMPVPPLRSGLPSGVRGAGSAGLAPSSAAAPAAWPNPIGGTVRARATIAMLRMSNTLPAGY